MSVSNGDSRKPNAVAVALLAVLGILVVSYLIPVLVTGNALWFQAGAGAKATPTSLAQFIPTATAAAVAPTVTMPDAAPTATETGSPGVATTAPDEATVTAASPTDAATAVPGAATATPAPAAPSDTPAAPAQSDSAPQETLARLAATDLPARDLYDLHRRFKLSSALQPTPAQPKSYKVGDTETFWVGNVVDNSYYTITAVLIDLTDHAYWWVQNDYPVSPDDVRSLAQVFEAKIYPTDRSNFGPEPGPGIENDPRITVLLAPINGAGGYFSSSDAYPRSINPYSNERKMIYIASDPASTYSLGTIAHEFQHMIHFNRHLQQDIWINEGLAELAIKLNGYDPGGVDVSFEKNTDIQLTNWANTPDKSRSNYGGAYLFMSYLYEHFGGAAAIDALMKSHGTNLDSVDNALQMLGKQERFGDVFTDWALANWLDGSGANPLYDYHDMKVKASASQSFSNLPASYKGTVHEQGTDYIDVSAGSDSDVKVTFQGDSTVPVVSTTPHSGGSMWWSNRSDLSDTKLSREFDLSGQSKATLSYWLWYDIEQDYDFGYVEVSADGGQTWDILRGQYSSDANPVGNNFGWGYSGLSGGGAKAEWVQEQLDLSAYAGKKLQVRFEYITDDGYNAQGMAVDDISIPELGYSDNAEAGDGGWQAEGFSRVGAAIPQHFTVAAISYPHGGTPQVQMLTLDSNNAGTLTVPANGKHLDRVVVMVGGLAPYTIQTTNYNVSIAAAR